MKEESLQAEKSCLPYVSDRMCLLLVYFEEMCKVSLSCKKAGVCSCNAPPWYRAAFELSTYQLFFRVSFLHVSLHSEITMKEGVTKVKSEN